MLTNKFTIKEIKIALIESVIDYNLEYFKPFLFSDQVKCEADKKAFYRWFKKMIASVEYSSVGPLTLRIEQPAYEEPGRQHYKFYDAAHVYSRLTIIVVESEDSIWIEVMPF